MGLVGFITILAIAISPLFAKIEKDAFQKTDSSFYEHQHKKYPIKGSMTLQEIEITTGVPAMYIIESLNLPETVSADEQLGRLKRKYGFELSNVKAIIQQYKNTE